MRESVAARRMRSRSTDLDTNKITVDAGTGKLIINSAISPCEPSHWSFGQLSTQVGAPAGYLRKLPMPLIVSCLNHGLQTAPREEVKFMTVANPDSEVATLQAVTSRTYGRIWDADVCDAVARIVEKSGGRFHNPLDWSHRPSGLYASDHDVFLFMIDGGSIVEAGSSPRDQLNRGFICWNSETGARTFGLMTFLFRGCCGNHLIWGATDINRVIIRHTSGGPSRFDSDAMPALRAYIDASPAPLVDTIKRAQQYLLPPEKDNGILEFANKHGKFSRLEIAEAVKLARTEEGDCRTLWQLCNGLTAYARGYDWIDSRVDLEKRAGSLLNIAAGVAA